MDDHLGILQKRVEAAAVGTERAFEQPKGIRSDIDESQKENLNASQDDRGVGKEARIGLIAKAENKAVSGQQERPEKQRAFLAGPQSCELVRSGKIAIAVMKDVSDGEVIAEGGDDESNGGKDDRSEDDDASAAGGLSKAFPGGITRKE